MKFLDGKVYYFVQIYFALPASSTRRAASRNVVLGMPQASAAARSVICLLRHA